MLRLLAIVASVALALAAAPPANADDELSLVEGAGAPGFYDLLQDVAEGAGYFKEAHLAITKNYAGSAAAASQLVASGKADVCSLSVEPALIGYAKGLSLQFFFMRLSRFGYVLAVTADSPIRTLADFKGKQIGEPGPGSPVEVVARSLLAGAGLAPSDYSFAPIGYAATNLQAVLSKRVDATADTYSNLITNEVESHVAYRIYRDPIIGDIGDAGYGARPATIATRGDVLKRFSRALAKAAVFVRADPQAAARLYMQAAGERITGGSLAAKTQVITLLEGDLPANDPANHRIGYVSGTGLALLSQALVTDGFALQPVPPSAIATNAFLTYTNDFNHNAVQTQAHTLH